MEDVIIFEQPLNEYIRICLRLETLFAQVYHYLTKDSIWDRHTTVIRIINLLHVIDRPDIKSKLTNALHSYVSSLKQLEQATKVDKDKLFKIINQLYEHIDYLHNFTGKLGQKLLENDFLTNIRQRISTPPCSTSFAMPSYYLWLQQPFNKQQLYIDEWLADLAKVEDIIKLLLQLTRDSTPFVPQEAKEGFYQETLIPGASYQMIRLKFAKELNLFPEISVGRHRLSIHFYTLKEQGKTTQITDDITFDLACCKL